VELRIPPSLRVNHRIQHRRQDSTRRATRVVVSWNFEIVERWAWRETTGQKEGSWQ
jgi:hypothetical protein